MNINWKNFIISIIVVLITVGAVGAISWSGMTVITDLKDEQIADLDSEYELLAEMATNKAIEKITADEAAAALESEASGTTKTKWTPVRIAPESDTTSETPTESTTEPAVEPEVEDVRMLYFYTTSCGACMIFTPVMQEVEGEGIIPISWFDVGATPSYISQYGITLVPTLIVNGHLEVMYTYTKEAVYSVWDTYK